MKMKKGLLMVVLLLALSSVMAAMSFSSAAVTSDMSFNISNTDESLLALTASNEHNASFYNSAGARKLVIDLDKGYDNKDFGIQNNSKYSWDGLFGVKNNSEHKIKVSIKTDPNAGKTGPTQGIKTFLKGALGSNWTQVNGMYGAGAGEYTFMLEPNETLNIDLLLESIQGSNKHATERKFNVIVSAEKVN